MAWIWRSDGTTRIPLTAGWVVASTAPGRVGLPSALPAAGLQWWPAQVPGTFAAALRQARALPSHALDFDADDVWFCCDCTLPEGRSVSLHFAGLATVADIYWGDQLLGQSRSMFVEQTLDMSGLPRSSRLSIHFKAMNKELAVRRARPRWRTRLVEQQQLRWLRTTLLGRIPAWSPPVASVGPYRPVEVVEHHHVEILSADLRTSYAGGDGEVTAALTMRCLAGTAVVAAKLVVAGHSAALALTLGKGLLHGQGRLLVSEPQLWWPHTHGEPARYPVKVELQLADPDAGPCLVDMGSIGFRSIKLDQTGGGFSLVVNGTQVFCRGACWTPTDIVSLASTSASLRPTLVAARDAGMNMIRVGGTMVYESPDFYALCDELGLMVWQDLMFANMDYPVADPDFAAAIKAEAEQFLGRVQASPALAIICGSSETEQQAAMLGLDKELWSNDFFANILPDLCAQLRPDVPYWPSSPSGGVLPFHVDSGVSHYYGVGAYLRPLDDARRAGVRFTAECLGFANVPCDETIEGFMKDGQAPVHHPAWKQRVPRDSGAGWDFEDVRDHYMRLLFSVDPLQVRYSDPQRYLMLARVTTGEVMAAVLAEWRRLGSSCQGALIWFLRDLWPGAGWGLIDAHGRPKAAYFYVRRAMAARALFLADEGLNGLVIHAVNDRPTPFSGQVELSLYRHGETCTAKGATSLVVPAHGKVQIRADALFEHFLDTTYAYRFGPAGHDTVVVRLTNTVAPWEELTAFHFPAGLPAAMHGDLGVEAEVTADNGGVWWLTVRSRRLAQSVAIDLKGFRAEDEFFHIAPGGARTVRLTATAAAAKPQGSVWPLNARQDTKVVHR